MERYNPKFNEKQTGDTKVLEYLDKAIGKLEEAKKILYNSGFNEATNVDVKNFMSKMNQAENLLYKSSSNLVDINNLQRDISIELFVKCRLKLVGTNTALSKEYNVSSWYSGSNVRSLILEMKNMQVSQFEEMAIERTITQFIVSCDTYNQVVQDKKNNFIIKKEQDLIIPDELIKI